MLPQSDYIKQLLQSQLEIYRETELFLKDVIGHKKGTEWGFEQVEKIDLYFNKTKKLQLEINEILNTNPEFVRKTELTNIVKKIKKMILSINRLIDILHIHVTGGQRFVFENLRNVLKGMEIKGYRQINILNKIGVDCRY